MATLSEDDTSWKSRSIKRRDFRHDPHAVDEVPKHRSPKNKRKHIKGCEHTPERISTGRYYNTYRCTKCGRREYYWSYRLAVSTRPNPHPVDPATKLEGSEWVIIERKKGE